VREDKVWVPAQHLAQSIGGQLNLVGIIANAIGKHVIDVAVANHHAEHLRLAVIHLCLVQLF
jgi:hypothetical protein